MNRNMYFDLKGYVKLEVIGAEEKDILLVSKQVGITPTTSKGEEVDITLRFVDRLAPEKMNYLGINQFGFTDKEFYLLNPLTGKTEVQIPLDKIGEKCEIICQRGITSIPLLTEILKISFLQKNILSLHASAVVHNKEGVVVMGWVRGGKTSATLAYIQQGAKFVADDWVLYDLEKDQVFGFPGMLSVSDYNLQQMPNFRSKLKFSKRAYLGGLKLIVRFTAQIANIFQVQQLRKILRKLKDKLRVDLSPDDIFAPGDIVKHVSPRKFLLMTSHNQKNIKTQQITANEMTDVFMHANDFDFLQLHETYLAYRFAFPDKKNIHIEERHNVEKQLLKKGLAGKETLRIFHPYPLPFDLFIEEIAKD